LEIEPPKEIPKVEEIKPSEKNSEVETPPEEKKVENPADKLKVIVKVFPKDIIGQFVLSGISKDKLNWNGEKIILSATITIEGKVRNAEIIGETAGEIIDLVAKTAAQSWIFEPYLDENGNAQDLKTQIEFSQEDF
jgi:hypothetical protein